MKKRLILSTLLLSTGILNTAKIDAATSAIKAESKKITITSKTARLFKDSKLKDYTTPKYGAVYQVNGYRDINGKHYYRLYQTNSKGESSYRGYLYSGYAKTLTLTKSSDKFIAKKDATLWNNLYFSQKKDILKEEKAYFVKGYYTLGDGKKYYSIYQKDSSNKDKWCGYTYFGNLKKLKMTKEIKKVTLTKNYSSWNNLYFSQKKKTYDYNKGVAFETRGYGKKFYSLNQKDINRNDMWCGYLNASATRDLQKEVAPQKYAYIDKAYKTYQNLYFKVSYDLKEHWNDKDFAQVAEADHLYKLGNGKKYVYVKPCGLYGTYINADALKFDNNIIKNYYIDTKNK